jgi:pantetheine-phosphate adenylyltransferase
MNKTRTALFPGTFDPFTNGHLDLVRRARHLFHRVVVAVADSPSKGVLFPLEERVEMIRAATRDLKGLEVVPFADLVVDCARRLGAHVMIRGLRAVSDFEFEFQMALMNRRLSPRLEVAFLMPSQKYTYLNSSLVKEVVRLGGDVSHLVPRVVAERLRRRLGSGSVAAGSRAQRVAGGSRASGRSARKAAVARGKSRKVGSRARRKS